MKNPLIGNAAKEYRRLASSLGENDSATIAAKANLERYGCIKTKVAGRGWTHWYKLPFMDIKYLFFG